MEVQVEKQHKARRIARRQLKRRIGGKGRLIMRLRDRAVLLAVARFAYFWQCPPILSVNLPIFGTPSQKKLGLPPNLSRGSELGRKSRYVSQVPCLIAESSE
jgi:hypothetical protein